MKPDQYLEQLPSQDSKDALIETVEISNHQYFSHIDGLRAMAIIPVVIYHLASALCPGGYAGVDVFFVISGFLITRGIFSDLNAKTFSLKNFYFRRIKRIIPAYFAIIAAVLAVFPFIYVFDSYRSIAKASLYSAFYCANIYFANNNGYFDFSNRQNPLLHLWSLSVEEQFYLLAPALVWIIWIFAKRHILYILGIFCGLSCAFSIFSITRGNSEFAFYMLPSRAWEILAGAIVSQIVFSRQIDGVMRSSLSWIGLILILFPYIFYTDKTPFPGIAAIPSVLGSSLLIAFGDRGHMKRILSWKPAVFVGKISYSVYLWHWPIILIVFLYCSSNRFALSFVTTMGVSYLSYRFIELPIRKSHTFNARRAFTLLAVGTILISTVCCYLVGKKSKLGSLPQSYRGTLTWNNFQDIRDRRRTDCTLGDLESGKSILRIGTERSLPSFALWGDSHALSLLNAVDVAAAKSGKAGYFVNLQHTFTSDDNNPAQYREPVLQWLEKRRDIVDVFLVDRWFSHLKTVDDIRTVVDICDRLKKAGKRVFFFTNVPEASGKALRNFEWNLPVPEELGSMKIETYRALATRQKQLTDNLTSRNLAKIIPLNEAFFDGINYLTVTSEVSYYRDTHHLSDAGALRAMNFAAPLIWQPSQ